MQNRDFNAEFERKRAIRQKKKRKKRAKAFLIFFVLLLIITLVVLSLTVFFPITSITAKGSKIYSQSEIIKASGLKKGDNTFAFLSDNTEEKIRHKLPYIKSVDTSRTLSGEIAFTVKDAKTDYCIKKGNAYYLIGSDNFVLEQCNTPPGNVTVLIFKDGVKCTVGEYVNIKKEDLKTAADSILQALDENEIEVNYIDLTDELSITAKVENRFEVSFGTMNDIDKKIAHLNGMINKIAKDKTGKINLGIWTKSNPEGTFVEDLPE